MTLPTYLTRRPESIEALGAVGIEATNDVESLPDAGAIVIIPDADTDGYTFTISTIKMLRDHPDWDLKVLPIQAMGFELQKEEGGTVADWLPGKSGEVFKQLCDSEALPAMDWAKQASVVQAQEIDVAGLDLGETRREYAIRRITEEAKEWLLFVSGKNDGVLARWGDNNTFPVNDERESRIKEVINHVSLNVRKPLPEGHPDNQLLSFINSNDANNHFEKWAYSTIKVMKRLDRIDGKGIAFCTENDLDAKSRYLGTLNGILDLKEGRLLSVEEIRDRGISVTGHIPVAFEEDATEKYPEKAEYFDKLFRHTEDPEYLKMTIASHLYGHPLKRIYFWIGPSDGGKSSLINVLSSVFGHYVVRPNTDIFLQKDKANAGPSPHWASVIKPTRLAVCDEISVFRIDSRLLKQLTDSEVTFRKPWGKFEITGKVSATFVLAFNDFLPPNINMEDAGLQSRVRCVYFPAIPDADRDMAFLSLHEDREFQRVFLRQIVEYTKQIELNAMGYPRQQVADSERILETTRDFFNIMGSPLQDLCDNLEFTGSETDILYPDTLWFHWCQLNEVKNLREKYVGNYSKRTLITAVKTTMKARGRDMGERKQRRVNGERQRGWIGWQVSHSEGGTAGKLTNARL